MRFNEQTKFGSGRGNCIAACVSSLLDLPIEDVPNVETLFFLDTEDNETPPLWAVVLDAFLLGKGYSWREATKEELDSEDMYFLVIGKGQDRVTNHACIYKGRYLFFDPNPFKKGLTELLSIQVIEKVECL